MASETREAELIAEARDLLRDAMSVRIWKHRAYELQVDSSTMQAVLAALRLRDAALQAAS